MLSLLLRAVGPEVLLGAMLELAGGVRSLSQDVGGFFAPVAPSPLEVEQDLFIALPMALPSALVKFMYLTGAIVCAAVLLLIVHLARAVLGICKWRRSTEAWEVTEPVAEQANSEADEGEGQRLSTAEEELVRQQAEHKLAMQAMQEKLAAAECERDAARLELQNACADAARKIAEHEEVQAWSISAAVTIKRLRKEVAALETSLAAERSKRQAWVEAYDERQEELHRRELEIIRRELRCYKEETWAEVAIAELRATFPLSPMADKQVKKRPPELTDWLADDGAEGETDEGWCRRGTGSTQVFSMDTPRTGEDSEATWSSSEETTSEA